MSKRVALHNMKPKKAPAVSSSGVASSKIRTHPAIPGTRLSLAGDDGAGKPEGGNGREDVALAAERPNKTTSSSVAPGVETQHQQQASDSSKDGTGGVQAKDAKPLQKGSSLPARRPIGDVQPQGSPEERTAGLPVALTTGHQHQQHKEQGAPKPTMSPFVLQKSEEPGVKVHKAHSTEYREGVNHTLDDTSSMQRQTSVRRSERPHKPSAKAEALSQQSGQSKVGARVGNTSLPSRTNQGGKRHKGHVTELKPVSAHENRMQLQAVVTLVQGHQHAPLRLNMDKTSAAVKRTEQDVELEALNAANAKELARLTTEIEGTRETYERTPQDLKMVEVVTKVHAGNVNSSELDHSERKLWKQYQEKSEQMAILEKEYNDRADEFETDEEALNTLSSDAMLYRIFWVRVMDRESRQDAANRAQWQAYDECVSTFTGTAEQMATLDDIAAADRALQKDALADRAGWDGFFDVEHALRSDMSRNGLLKATEMELRNMALKATMQTTMGARSSQQSNLSEVWDTHEMDQEWPMDSEEPYGDNWLFPTASQEDNDRLLAEQLSEDDSASQQSTSDAQLAADMQMAENLNFAEAAGLQWGPEDLGGTRSCDAKSGSESSEDSSFLQEPPHVNLTSDTEGDAESSEEESSDSDESEDIGEDVYEPLPRELITEELFRSMKEHMRGLQAEDIPLEEWQRIQVCKVCESDKHQNKAKEIMVKAVAEVLRQRQEKTAAELQTTAQYMRQQLGETEGHVGLSEEEYDYSEPEVFDRCIGERVIHRDVKADLELVLQPLNEDGRSELAEFTISDDERFVKAVAHDHDVETYPNWEPGWRNITRPQEPMRKVQSHKERLREARAQQRAAQQQQPPRVPHPPEPTKGKKAPQNTIQPVSVEKLQAKKEKARLQKLTEANGTHNAKGQLEGETKQVVSVKDTGRVSPLIKYSEVTRPGALALARAQEREAVQHKERVAVEEEAVRRQQRKKLKAERRSNSRRQPDSADEALSPSEHDGAFLAFLRMKALAHSGATPPSWQTATTLPEVAPRESEAEPQQVYINRLRREVERVTRKREREAARSVQQEQERNRYVERMEREAAERRRADTARIDLQQQQRAQKMEGERWHAALRTQEWQTDSKWWSINQIRTDHISTLSYDGRATDNTPSLEQLRREFPTLALQDDLRAAEKYNLETSARWQNLVNMQQSRAQTMTTWDGRIAAIDYKRLPSMITEAKQCEVEAALRVEWLREQWMQHTAALTEQTPGYTAEREADFQRTCLEHRLCSGRLLANVGSMVLSGTGPPKVSDAVIDLLSEEEIVFDEPSSSEESEATVESLLADSKLYTLDDDGGISPTMATDVRDNTFLIRDGEIYACERELKRGEPVMKAYRPDGTRAYLPTKQTLHAKRITANQFRRLSQAFPERAALRVMAKQKRRGEVTAAVAEHQRQPPGTGTPPSLTNKQRAEVRATRAEWDSEEDNDELLGDQQCYGLQAGRPVVMEPDVLNDLSPIYHLRDRIVYLGIQGKWYDRDGVRWTEPRSLQPIGAGITVKQFRSQVRQFDDKDNILRRAVTKGHEKRPMVATKPQPTAAKPVLKSPLKTPSSPSITKFTSKPAFEAFTKDQGDAQRANVQLRQTIITAASKPPTRVKPSKVQKEVVEMIDSDPSDSSVDPDDQGEEQDSDADQSMAESEAGRSIAGSEVSGYQSQGGEQSGQSGQSEGEASDGDDLSVGSAKSGQSGVSGTKNVTFAAKEIHCKSADESPRGGGKKLTKRKEQQQQSIQELHSSIKATKPAKLEEDIQHLVKMIRKATKELKLPKLETRHKEALKYLALTLPDGASFPPIAVMDVMQTMLNALMEVRDGGGVAGPDEKAVFWRNLWREDEELPADSDNSSAPTPAWPGIVGGNFVYMGSICSPERARRMSLEEQQYLMSIMDGKVLIDGSGRIPEFDEEGDATVCAGEQYITALLNCNREPAENPCRLKKPTRGDFGELIVEFHRMRGEVTFWYGQTFRWEVAKLKLLRQITAFFTSQLQEPRCAFRTATKYTRQARWAANQGSIESMTAADLVHLRSLTLEQAREQSKAVFDRWTLLTVIDETFEAKFAVNKLVDGQWVRELERPIDGSNPQKLVYPMQLLLFDGLRKHMAFGAKQTEHVDLSLYADCLTLMGETGMWQPEELMLRQVRGRRAERLRQQQLEQRQEKEKRAEHLKQQRGLTATIAEQTTANSTTSRSTTQSTEPVDENNSSCRNNRGSMSGGVAVTAPTAQPQPSTQATEPTVVEVVEEIVKVKTEPAEATELYGSDNIGIQMDGRHVDVAGNDALLYATMRARQPLSITALERLQTLIDARHKVVQAVVEKKITMTPESKRDRRKLAEIQEFLTLEARELEKLDKLMRRYMRKERSTKPMQQVTVARALMDAFNEPVNRMQIRKGATSTPLSRASPLNHTKKQSSAARQVPSDGNSSSSGGSSDSSSESDKSRDSSDMSDLSDDGEGHGKRHTSHSQRRSERERVKRVKKEAKASQGPVRVGPWEHYPIRVGDENLYREPSNMATGVYNHKWPPGRKYLKLIRIPNYSTTDEKGRRRRPAKQVRRMFEAKDMNNHAKLNTGNVITWLNELCHAMARHDVSPYAVATELERGFNMEASIYKNFLMLVQSRRNQPNMKPVDNQDFEGAILWLDALMRCLMEEYGPEVNQAEHTRMKAASTLRLKTRTLAGVRQLWTETVHAFSDMAPGEATFSVLFFAYSAGLMRNPYVDHNGTYKPGALMDKYQVEWRSAEQELMHRTHNPMRAPAMDATETERFDYQNEMVREISRAAKLLNQNHSEFPDPTAEGSNRRRSHHSTNANSSMVVHQMEQLSVEDEDWAEFGWSADESVYYSAENGDESRVMYLHYMNTGPKLQCTVCGYVGHEAPTCTVAVNGAISQEQLANLPEEKCKQRCYAAWQRGGQLTGMTADQYHAYLAEIAAIRVAKPPQQQQPWKPNQGGNGGGRGSGGYNQGNGGGRGNGGNNYGQGGGRGYGGNGSQQQNQGGNYPPQQSNQHQLPPPDKLACIATLAEQQKKGVPLTPLQEMSVKNTTNMQAKHTKVQFANVETAAEEATQIHALSRLQAKRNKRKLQRRHRQQQGEGKPQRIAEPERVQEPNQSKKEAKRLRQQVVQQKKQIQQQQQGLQEVKQTQEVMYNMMQEAQKEVAKTYKLNADLLKERVERSNLQEREEGECSSSDTERDYREAAPRDNPPITPPRNSKKRTNNDRSPFLKTFLSKSSKLLKTAGTLRSKSLGSLVERMDAAEAGRSVREWEPDSADESSEETVSDKSPRVQELTTEHEAADHNTATKGMCGILMHTIRQEDLSQPTNWAKQEAQRKLSATSIFELERPTGNSALTYLGLGIEPTTAADAKMGYSTSVLADVTQYQVEQMSFYTDTGQHAVREPVESLVVQYDGGAGCAVMSRAFVERLNFQTQAMRRAMQVVGYDGSTSIVSHIAEAILTIAGRDTRGYQRRRRCKIQALVVEELHVDFILGAREAHDFNIVVTPDTNTATIFRGEELLHLGCMDWSAMQAAIAKRQGPHLPIHSMQNMTVTERSDNTFEEIFCKHISVQAERYGASSAKDVIEQCYQCNEAAIDGKTGNRGQDRQPISQEQVENLVGLVVTAEQKAAEREVLEWALRSPATLFRLCVMPFKREIVAATVILARHFNRPEIKDTVARLRKGMFGKGRLMSQDEFNEWIRQREVESDINMVRFLTNLMVHEHGRVELQPLNVHTCVIAAEVMEETKQKAQDELNITKKALEILKSQHCTESMPERRPEGFPVELWRWVFDKQKPLVKERWARFDVDPERRQELIKKVMKIDISRESEARSLEEPVFRACALANLDRFGHTTATDQPRVKGYEFKIDLEEKDNEPAVARYQRFDPWQTRFLHCKLKIMVEQERMERSTSRWNSRLSLVPYTERIQAFIDKHSTDVAAALADDKNSDEISTFFRLTTDLRAVNIKTKPMVYPLPNIANLIDRCSGVDRYSTGDIEDAFFTVQMEQESREMTAFSTPGGRYQYKVMPQGARNSATFWAEMIAEIFKPLLGKDEPMIVFQDDVANHAKELNKHLELQQQIFDILRAANMIFKPSKMHFNYKTQRILGHVLSGEGRTVDAKTLEAIRDIKIPTTQTEVRAILGLFQWTREYVEHLSSIMEPLQALAANGVDIPAVWDDKIHGVALEVLKLAVTSAPVLKIADINKPFVIQTDACRVGRGIGGILLQRDEEGKLRPCAFWSRALSKGERRYSATMLECTALHDVILHWKIYLRNGHPFEAIVDHYALVYMVTKMGTEQQNQKLDRLCLDLQGFHFKVTHVAGKAHLGADAVSRLLRFNEEPYVRDTDELRDDFGPLSEAEIKHIHSTYPEAQFIIDTITNERRERERQREEMITDGQEEMLRKAIERTEITTTEVVDTKAEQPRAEDADVCGVCGEETETPETVQIKHVECTHCHAVQIRADNSAARLADRLLRTAHNEVHLARMRFSEVWRQRKREARKQANRVELDILELVARQQRALNRMQMQGSEQLVDAAMWPSEEVEHCRGQLDKYQQLGTIQGQNIKLRGLAEIASASLEAAKLDERLVRSVRATVVNELNKRELQRQSATTRSQSNLRLYERLEIQWDERRRERPRSRVRDSERMAEEREIQTELIRRNVWGRYKAVEEAEMSESDAWKQRRLEEAYEAAARVLAGEGADQRAAERRQNFQTHCEAVRVNMVHATEAVSGHMDTKIQRVARVTDVLRQLERAHVEREATVDLLLHVMSQEEKQAKSQVQDINAKLKLQNKRQKVLEQQLERSTNQVERIQRDQLYTELRKQRKGRMAGKRRKAAADQFDDEEEHARVEQRLEEHYDCLNGEHYMCPVMEQLHQVVDVYVHPQTRQFMSVARPMVTKDNHVNVHQGLQRRAIEGVDGTKSLISMYREGRRDVEDQEVIPESNNEWLALQEVDAHWGRMVERLGREGSHRLPLDRGTPAESTVYLERKYDADGVLGPIKRVAMSVKKVVNGGATINITRKVEEMVVPKSLQNKVMWLMHEGMGHPGRNRTTETTKMQYWWSTMYSDIARYCKACRYCRLRKANNQVAKVPIMVYDYAERPCSRVHADLAGPFPRTDNLNVYILVLKDALTKWVELIPIKEKTMETVQMMYLEHWVARYGAPQILITDRGSEFHNKMAFQLATLLGARKVSTTPKNPRSDGQVENQMRTIKDMLVSFCNKFGTDWDRHIAFIMQAYNTTPNDATGFTPAYLMYGREQGGVDEEYLEKLNMKKYHVMVQDAAEALAWCWQYVGDRVVKNGVKFQRVPRERMAFQPYEVGDFFFRRVVAPRRAQRSSKAEKAYILQAKLQYRFTGPYMVTKVWTPVLYEAMIHGRTCNVHALNMKPAGKDRKPRVRKEQGKTETVPRTGE